MGSFSRLKEEKIAEPEIKKWRDIDTVPGDIDGRVWNLIRLYNSRKDNASKSEYDCELLDAISKFLTTKGIKFKEGE